MPSFPQPDTTMTGGNGPTADAGVQANATLSDWLAKLPDTDVTHQEPSLADYQTLPSLSTLAENGGFSFGSPTTGAPAEDTTVDNGFAMPSFTELSSGQAPSFSDVATFEAPSVPESGFQAMSFSEPAAFDAPTSSPDAPAYQPSSFAAPSSPEFSPFTLPNAFEASPPSLPSLSSLSSLPPLPSPPLLSSLPSLPSLGHGLDSSMSAPPAVAMSSADLPDDGVAYAVAETRPSPLQGMSGSSFATFEPFNDTSADEPESATWTPHPSASLNQSSWSEDTFGPQGEMPVDIDSANSGGTPFRLRDDGGFAPTAHDAQAEVTNLDPVMTPSMSRFNLGKPNGEEESPKAKKTKAKKAPKSKSQARSDNPFAESAGASSTGAASASMLSKLKGAFKKSEPPTDAEKLQAELDEESTTTARLVRILASMSLVTGLLLGGYTILSDGEAPTPSTVIPVLESTVPVTVPDVGLAPLPPTEAPPVSAEVPAEVPVTAPADELDFSTGEDFTFSSGGDFSA